MFPTMVAFGANSAHPHWLGSSKRLSPGDIILIDLGGRVDGYGADITRTFFWKKMTAKQNHRYQIIRFGDGKNH